jgi:hypothetical protein
VGVAAVISGLLWIALAQQQHPERAGQQIETAGLRHGEEVSGREEERAKTANARNPIAIVKGKERRILEVG